MTDKSVRHFLLHQIWHMSEKDYAFPKSQMLQALKICYLSIQGFQRDLCSLRASALTLYTLLSIVPVIALLFGVAKGFGFEKKLEQDLLEQLQEQDTFMLQVIGFAQNMLATTKGGLIAGIGIVVLFWTVIKVISNIEESFNSIWQIQENRPWSRKVSDYLSLMMLAPVLLIASSSITIFVKTQIAWLVEWIRLPDFGTRVVLYLMSFSPMFIMMFLFSFLFIFIPNKKITLKAGISAGILTGFLYQLVQLGYISLQIGASSYNAIYGSFAALPLFLVWLQLVWCVVLFGCEVAFYIQNFEVFRHNDHFEHLSPKLKKNIAIKVCGQVAGRFSRAEKAISADELATDLKLPLAVVQNTLSELIAVNILVELKVADTETPRYQPAKDIGHLDAESVLESLETHGINQLPGFEGQVSDLCTRQKN